MLICVFIFEMEGLDEGSWIKVLNLIPGAQWRCRTLFLDDWFRSTMFNRDYIISWHCGASS